MSNLNQVFLIGILGANPEERILKCGKKKVVINLAVTEKNNDDYESVTHWFKIGALSSVANKVMKELKKGDKITLEGRLTISEYENSKQKQLVTEVLINDFIKC